MNREELNQINRDHQPPFSIGFGYDVHQFDENRPLFLGGVLIPEGPGLDGHSDADVLIHAIMDAMLGAAGLPDIGHYFPPTDDQWKGVRSTVLLKKVCETLYEAGWVVGNIDASIVAEVPKVNPYADQMKIVLSELISLPKKRIGIKATTNEKMGFIGRKEGMTAYASVLCLRIEYLRKLSDTK